MTFREKLLSAPKRKWDEILHNVSSLYIIPTKRKHDSGYNCMIYVAVVEDEDGNEKYVRCGGYSDHLWATSYQTLMTHTLLSIDCDRGVLRLHSFGKNGFSVGSDLSSVEITPTPGD